MIRLILSLLILSALSTQAFGQQWLKQSTATTVKLGPFIDSTDGVTPEEGLTISQADVRLSKQGGTYAQKNDSSAATHDDMGEYSINLNATDTNTLGRLRIMIQEAGALPVWQEYLVVPAHTYDVLVMGEQDGVASVMALTDEGGYIADAVVAGTFDTIDALDDDIAAIKTKTDFLPSATAGTNGGLPTVNASNHIVGIQSGGITSGSFASGAINASAIASDALTAAKIASDVGAEIRSGLLTDSAFTTYMGTPEGANYMADIQAIGFDVDDIRTNVTTIVGYTDTFDIISTQTYSMYTDGVRVAIMDENTITASAIADDAIDAGAIATNAIAVGTEFTGSVTLAADQSAVTYFGAFDITDDEIDVTVSGALDANVVTVEETDASTYLESRTLASASYATASSLSSLQSSVDNGVTISSGGLTATSIAADAFTAAKFAADVSTEIRTGLLTDSAFTTYMGTPEGANYMADVQSIGTDVDTVLTAIADVPTVSEFNARTLTSSNYATASGLNTVASVVDDIYEDTGTTLPATLSGLATQSSVDTIDTEVGNILSAYELDGSVYRLTTNALEQGGAVSLDPEDIEAIGLAAAEGIDNEAIATAVWADTTATGLLTSVADIPTNAELATAIDGVTFDDAAILAAIADVPTVSEFNARTLASASYATASNQSTLLTGVNVSSIGTNVITASAIADNAIDAGAIASNAITSSELANNAITAAKIATDAITSNQLAATAVTEVQSGLATSSALTTAQSSLTSLTTAIADVPTNAELTTALAGVEFDDTDILTAIADVPTNAELATALTGIEFDDTDILAAISDLQTPITNIYTAFENDGGQYRLTTNALEQGGAVSLDPSDIEAIGLAAAEGIDNEAIAAAVWSDTTATTLTASVEDLPTNSELATALNGVTFDDSEIVAAIEAIDFDDAAIMAAISNVGTDVTSLINSVDSLPTHAELATALIPLATAENQATIANTLTGLGTQLADIEQDTSVNLPAIVNALDVGAAAPAITERVPTSRTATIQAIAGQGLRKLGPPFEMKAGTDANVMYAADFAHDLQVNGVGDLATIVSITVVPTGNGAVEGGLTLDSPTGTGILYSQAKYKVTAVTPGNYNLEIVVLYAGSSTPRAAIVPYRVR